MKKESNRKQIMVESRNIKGNQTSSRYGPLALAQNLIKSCGKIRFKDPGL